MNANQSISRHDQKVDVKVVLSGLWSRCSSYSPTSTSSPLRENVINGALDGKVAGAGFDINQCFLTDPPLRPRPGPRR